MVLNSSFTKTLYVFVLPLEKEMATHSRVLALENPRDGRAWWAAVYGFAQSQTRLKRLHSIISVEALEQSLRAIWGVASWAAILILPQIKLNSQLSSCAFFFVRQEIKEENQETVMS